MAGSARSRRAAWSFWTRSVVRLKSTRLPSSTSAAPMAAARWVLPVPLAPKISRLPPCSSQASARARAMMCALRTLGTAAKSKVAKVLPCGRPASAMRRAMRRVARSASSEALVEHLPGTAIDRAREQLVAEHRAAERLRLPDQGTHQVAIVDDAQARPVALEVTPRHGQHRGGAEMADQAVIVDMHLEAAADEARGHGVEHRAHRYGA